MAQDAPPGWTWTPASALAVLAGAVAVQTLPQLPPWWASAGLALAAALAGWRCRWLGLPALAVLGFLWVVWRAALALDARLPHEFENRDLRVEATVSGLGVESGRAQRIDLVVARAWVDGNPVPFAGRVRAANYDHTWRAAPGAVLEAIVRLRRPRGTQNPGGFDFERHALERGYVATGQVTRVLREAPAHAWSVDARRHAISTLLAGRKGDVAATGVLRALAVGDQSAIPEPAWDTLRATGTAHLVAISGFHIGLVAGLGALFARVPYRVAPTLALRAPRRHAEAAFALAAAVAYAMLAGLSLPVLRTLLMIGVVLAASLARRNLGPAQALALALGVILAFDPLALLGAGFWLSFAGVAWLLLCLGGRPRVALVRQFGRAQFAMSIGLLPLCTWFFQQGSVVGPLANVLAVPLVSLGIVPVLLAGIAIGGGLGPAGDALLSLAHLLTRMLLVVLERMADWPWSVAMLPQPPAWALGLAVLGALVMLLPRELPGRMLGLALLLPLLVPRIERPEIGEIEVTVLDVGQGLAVVVRTATQALLYDAGPAIGGGLDLGDAVVVPALTALGIKRLDVLIISHGDNDHAGGAGSVRRRMRPRQVVRGGDVPGPGEPCASGRHWTIDGVAFGFLHPPPGFPALGNQSSCVLRVAGPGAALLLPGDIDAVVESRLLRTHQGALRSALVLAPHHGSRSSSSAAFVDGVAPRAVAVSAAHRSRFGHPAAEVTQRWQAAGAVVFKTSSGGALTWRLRADGELDGPYCWRESNRRYWHER